MRITLQIENVDRLETGGQVSYSCADRGFDIGRHEHLDWSLPDPQRVISGKHCEIRFEGGSFILHDVSTNGTFLNGNPNRMDKPHMLRSGDRLMIGDYIVCVALEADDHPGFSAAPVQPAMAHTPPFAAPISAESASGWPAAPSQSASAPHSMAPSQPSPYPMQEAGSPWSSDPHGMEGRHAPPSAAPGIGTPADDVWSQQGHGWGSADPALYDPAAQHPERAAARPFQADPLDHLAQQPELSPSPAPSPAPALQPGAAPITPFGGDASASRDAPPLFNMPDLGEAESQDVEPDPAGPAGTQPLEPVESASAAVPFPASDTSPFPEEGAWGPAEPEIAKAAGAAAADPARPDPVGEPDRMPPPKEPPVQPERLSLAEEETSLQAVQRSPVPAIEAHPTPRSHPEPAAPSADFLAAFAAGAGIAKSVLEDRDPEEFAHELGAILQGVTGDLMGLLQARSQVKAMTRNSNRTLISRTGNNALKFSPTPQMALQTMLSKSAEDNGYLPMDEAMSAAFKDIQKHHVWTYAAMQKAAARFDQSLSPVAIENEGSASKSTFGNQKAKLWERIQERWTSLSGSYDDGLVGVFTQYFTESYEELSSDDPEKTG